MKPLSLSCFLVPLAAFAMVAFLAGCPISVKKTESVKAVVSTPEEQTQATASLRAFLSEVDKENGETWDYLSPTLKATVSQMSWSAAIGSMKLACGKKLSRGQAQFACTEELPGAPKGRYFIFDIDSKFERAALTERVVLSLEKDQWKVAGYFRTKKFSFRDETKKP